ncbi:hypothetical protein [Pseudonocardia adelaidensis]|uniref:hypothetical protein n=1 Tax=Pseudonocardia adelaidensis TaxID=648754 RepID=UPI0031EA861E
MLVFAGLPILIVAIVTVVVFATTKPRAPRQPIDPPAGLVAGAMPCRVGTGTDGRRIHLPMSEPTDGDISPCLQLACAECGTPYQEGGSAQVHFSSPRRAIETARARGWTLAGYRVRCRRCA